LFEVIRGSTVILTFAVESMQRPEVTVRLYQDVLIIGDDERFFRFEIAVPHEAEEVLSCQLKVYFPLPSARSGASCLTTGRFWL